MNQEQESVRLNKLLARAYAGKNLQLSKKKLYEEYYFSDVERTGTMFTQEQLDEVKDHWNIPVNTKMVYPIVEQILSILTATRPYPKLLSTTQGTSDWTDIYTEGFHGVWYESSAQKKLRQAIRDMLNVGLGYLDVRENNFYEETTFNVNIDYINWKQVFIDPECKSEDLKDADFVFILESVRKSRAEREHNIIIREELKPDGNNITYQGVSAADIGVVIRDSYSEPTLAKLDDDQYVIVKKSYEKKEQYIYLSDDGYISVKRPIVEIRPNQDKKALKLVIDELTQSLKKGEKTSSSIKGSLDNPTNTFDENNQIIESEADKFTKESQEYNQLKDQLQQGQERLKQLINTYSMMPSKVTIYKMKLENGETIETTGVVKMRKKRVLRSIMVGDTVINQKWLNIDRLPIVQFSFNWLNAIRNFGLNHQFADIVKALDKTIALSLKEMATNTNRKVLYPNGAFIDPVQAERDFSVPGAFIGYDPDPTLKNDGEPKVIDPSNMNQTIVAMISYFKAMVEYVTGIYGVMQGNANEAPDTFSATQSLQNLGMQRVKLYARNIEESLENLAYVIVNFMQIFTPRDKVLKYFDENDDAREVSIMDDSNDLQFKVRVDIASMLPTTRHQAFQALTNIAQTAGDPDIATLLTQYALEIVDLPQAKKWVEQLDMFKRLKQQMDSLQQQLDEKDSLIKSMENNMTQKEVAHRIDIEAERAKGDIKTEKEVAKTNIQNQAEALTEEPGAEEESDYELNNMFNQQTEEE